MNRPSSIVAFLSAVACAMAPLPCGGTQGLVPRLAAEIRAASRVQTLEFPPVQSPCRLDLCPIPSAGFASVRAGLSVEGYLPPSLPSNPLLSGNALASWLRLVPPPVRFDPLSVGLSSWVAGPALAVRRWTPSPFALPAAPRRDPIRLAGLRPPPRYARAPWRLSVAKPLASGAVQLVAARIVRDGLADGTLNPRNPAWRPHLVRLLAAAGASPDAEVLFTTLLAGCAGADDMARLAVVESWAARFEEGRHAETVAHAAARFAFSSGDYAGASRRCASIASAYPASADRAMLLQALSEAYAGNRAEALRLLAGLRKQLPDSPSVPEARLLEAWLALQDLRNDDAAAILRDIVATAPKSPAAAKASQMLSDLAMPH